MRAREDLLLAFLRVRPAIRANAEPIEVPQEADVQPELRVSSVEVCFDLVFVFTITQLTSLLTRELSPSGVVQVVLIFVVLFWMYGGYAWLTNQVPPVSTAANCCSSPAWPRSSSARSPSRWPSRTRASRSAWAICWSCSSTVAAITDRVRMALYGYFYACVPMLLGITSVAAGVKLAISTIQARLPLGPALLVGGGVALYLVGHALFRWAMRIPQGPHRLSAAGVALLSLALGVWVAGLAQLVGLVAVLVVMLALERSKQVG